MVIIIITIHKYLQLNIHYRTHLNSGHFFGIRTYLCIFHFFLFTPPLLNWGQNFGDRKFFIFRGFTVILIGINILKGTYVRLSY